MNVNQIIEEYKKSKKYSFYENFCIFSHKIFKIELSKEEEERMREINSFCRLRIPAGSNISASILTFILGLPLLYLSGIFFGFSVLFVLFILLSFLVFLVYNYPSLKAKLIRNFAASEMMHAIIYMSISLKQTPNLEKAVQLVSTSLNGEIGKDFKRVLAKFLIGESDIKEGLNEIIERWYKEGSEFCEALKLLIAYSENPINSENLIKEALRVIHEESFERMERYARELKLPSTIILGLGIILPLLSLTVLPLFSIFFPQIFSFTNMFIVFNVLLPTILFLLILSLITSRPVTTSFLIAKNPLEIKLFGKEINIIFIGLVLIFLLALVFLPGFFFRNRDFELCSAWASTNFRNKPKELLLNKEECEVLLSDYMGIITSSISSLFILVVPIPIILFLKLRNLFFKREKIKKVESEFPSILYQIGYYLKLGNPLEHAINKGIEKYKKFETSRLFEKLLSVMSISGNIREGIENALKDYPSSIIKNAFEIIYESYKKGYRFAGETMIVISEYLSSLFKLQNKIEELISDTVNNLKFIVTFLMPIIVGVGIALVSILLSLLFNVSLVLGGIQKNETESLPILGLPFISITNVGPIPFGSLSFSLGLYVVETAIIASLLIVGLENGLEKYNFLMTLSKILVISVLFYSSTVLVATTILKPLIESVVNIGI